MAAPALKQNPVKRISVEEYLRLEEAADTKHEYVGGNIVAMAGASDEHNDIGSNLIREVGIQIKGKGCKIRSSDARVTTLAGKNYFYPDATVICGKAQNQPGIFDTLTNPIVIFEVISESTENIDRGYKFFYYQQIPSLQEYVLVDSREYAVDVIRRQADGVWKFEKYFQADEQVHLISINCVLSFKDIYFEIQLPRPE